MSTFLGFGRRGWLAFAVLGAVLTLVELCDVAALFAGSHWLRGVGQLPMTGVFAYVTVRAHRRSRFFAESDSEHRS